MRNLFTKDMHILPAGQAVSGVAGRTQTLRVHGGRVWLTVEGISHDYFLHPGDTFTAMPGRLIVVEAEHDAKLELPRVSASRTFRSMRMWLSGIAQRLTQTGTAHVSLKRHRACGNTCS